MATLTVGDGKTYSTLAAAYAAADAGDTIELYWGLNGANRYEAVTFDKSMTIIGADPGIWLYTAAPRFQMVDGAIKFQDLMLEGLNTTFIDNIGSDRKRVL